MRVREAKPSDLPAMMEIERVSFAHPWPAPLVAHYFERPEAVVLVAENPAVVGFLIAVYKGWPRRVVHVHDLAVDPTHRNQGVGTALLHELVTQARTRGAQAVRLEVRVSNIQARRFYEHRGFHLLRVVPHYYEDGEDALHMELPLTRKNRAEP